MSELMSLPQNARRGNVLLIGNSGVGKSTLINAVLGDNVAKTGYGSEGTTRELAIYESREIAFRLIDTVGFEPSFFKENKAIRAVQKWSKNSAKEGREDTQINVIWFCVDGTSRKLFEKTISNLSRATSLWPSVPVVVVITKSYSVPDRAENIEMVHNAFARQKRHPVNLRGVIPVVAATYTLNDTAYAPPEGIAELIDRTNELIPEGLRAGAKDVGKFILDRKRAMAQSVVGVATAGAAAVGAVPIPFPDALLLGPVEIGEINAIARIYGIKNSAESKRMLNSIVEVGTVGVGAKAAINALKAIPGVNLGASLINAVTAGSIAAALGEGAAHVFEQIYLGNKTTADIDWVTKMMESKFAGSFVKRLNTAVSELPANAGKEEIARVILKLLRAK